MGLAKSFQEALRKQLHMHAAWLPVANVFEPGSFGVVEGGVLRPMGHLRDFGVEFPTRDGPPLENVDFASKGVKVLRFAGGAEVPELPPAPELDARLRFDFAKEDGCVLRAPRLELREMESLHAIGQEVAKLPGWDRKYRVVSGVYRAESCLALLAGEAGTTIELSGKVAVLRALETGRASADFAFRSSTESSLNLSGSGVVGLKLFRIGWRDRIRLLADAEEAAVVEVSPDEELVDAF